MNHAKLEELRKTIDNRDLLMAEKWIRECGRASIEGWLTLSEPVRADIMSAILILAKTRPAAGYTKLPRLQKLRLEKHWSLDTARGKTITSGWSNMPADALNSLEFNPKKRKDLAMAHVHALESTFDCHFEALMEPVEGRRIPPGKMNSESER